MFNIKIRFISFLTILLSMQCINSSYSQFDSHPELDWFTIETKHFYINYHSGTERTANTVAKIAEEVYGPITSLYKYEPDQKISFIINDVSDISNGATDYYGNRIEIFATALDYDLRGTHNWLRNVITHEFTHAIQIQCAMKFSRKMPAVYLQWLGYENEIRPDVLYGYPNVIVSYPLSGVGVPAWFAEGTSQYQRQQLSYEQWDSHRDMILRSYIEKGNILTWGEMGQFSSITSLKAESIYNLGYGLTRYIAEKYGEDKLRAITIHLGDLMNFSMDKAIKDAIGIDGKDLYYEWINFLKKDYGKKLAAVKKDSVVGNIIEYIGFANYNPQFSPDGKKIAYLSNQDFDYGSTGLFIYDISTKRTENISSPVSTNYCWSPDGKKIIYAKRNSPQTIHHSTVFDLYEYNVKSQEENRLTTNLRAYSPSYSPSGKMICFVVNKDGTLNLEIADANGKNNDPITAFNNGEQVYNPKFSRDGKKIIFDFSYEDSRKLAEIEIETGKISYLLDDPGVDYRNPFYSKDGKKLYFSSNRTGIFNIYSMNLESKEVKQLTNVLGGAFMPSVDTSGNLVYSLYTAEGYKIALLRNYTERDTAIVASYQRPDPLIKKYAAIDTLKAGSDFDWLKLKNYNDRNITKFETKPYKSQFTSLSFVPVLRFDTYKRQDQYSFFEAIKPGVYFFSNEVLNRFSIFGGASINIEGERDLFLQFSYDNGFPFFKDFFTKTLKFNPRFSLDGYNVTRKSQGSFVAGADTINVGITYDLLSFDFGMAFNIINFNHQLRLGYSFNNYSYIADPFALPSGITTRASRETYFRANDIGLQYQYDFTYPDKNSDINPVGRNISVLFDYEMSDINPTLTVNEDGSYTTEYEANNLFKIYGFLSQGFGFFDNKHSLTLKLSGATIFGPPVESFYDYYASGLPGMKGYPFYSIGGGRMVFGNLTYRFPLISKIDTRVSPMYLDKLYLSFYGDYGNAWNGSDFNIREFKSDVGAQLRLQAFSFYVFPTSFFFDAAYGFNKFSDYYQGQPITYGQEWNFYFGMLFGFDL